MNDEITRADDVLTVIAETVEVEQDALEIELPQGFNGTIVNNTGRPLRIYPPSNVEIVNNSLIGNVEFFCLPAAE